MATGLNTQLTKQIGEYLVACELARRGFLTATFSGNVPEFDLIATNSKGESIPIQVKTINGKAWQFSIDRFVEITFEGDFQRLGKKKKLPVPNLISVFVVAGKKYGEDQFFVLEWSKVQEIIIAHHRNYLDSHGGKRPKKPDSLHCSLTLPELESFRDRWELIEERL